MECPKCGHHFKDPDRSKGGKRSKRIITPEQQAKMQKARKKKAECDHQWDYEPKGFCSGEKTRTCKTCGVTEKASTPY